MNYLNESKEKQELNSMLNSYNLVSVIHFPTRTIKNSRTTIDISLHKTKLANFATFPLLNGLSDHDAQILEIYLHNLNCKKLMKCKVTTIRKIDSNSIKEFKEKLSEELWQNVFGNNSKDVDGIFNSF
jgi:hypothetical protein